MSSRSKAALLGGSSTFDAVAPQPVSARGRALAALDGRPVDAETALAAATGRARLDQLAHNPFNPRETLTEIKEMADSLEARGIIQPVTVVTRSAFLNAHPKQEGRIGAADYVVLDGNRRLAGANLAGLDDLPIHIDDSQAQTADDMLESALVAAVQHVEIEPLDQAKALERLVTVHGSQRQVAKRLGKSHVWVSQRLALLNLTPELQQAVEAKEVPVEVARAAGRLPQEQQGQAVEEALEERRTPRNLRTAAGGNAVSTPPRRSRDASTEGGNGVSTPALNEGEIPPADVPKQRPDASAQLTDARSRVSQLGATAVDWAATLRAGCTEEELETLLEELMAP
ncbi:ParB family chromosome partitioning protein [Kitasatospora sp. MAP12-15]|uniref:ParB/RepB/Spo0J family partition protein n=1 Tax=unclassified Kitasatospora TaxID=2633591 RepID=UPI00247323D0|nr:ParB/RepB/Spo0J family partition protein [Kitasatospora sp. MAP12-44]MDH6107791.1 ParB family chromosome partitioning protein [Kitasatospora sp. MAP12-44]